MPLPLCAAGPMQISLGDKAAGYLPWAGGGESWVCWRYSHARPVAALQLCGGLPQLHQADFELGYLDPVSGEFTTLLLRQSASPNGGGLLNVQASTKVSATHDMCHPDIAPAGLGPQPSTGNRASRSLSSSRWNVSCAATSDCIAPSFGTASSGASPEGCPQETALRPRLVGCVQASVAAEEWQLSWTARGVHARALLACLRVNPSSILKQPAGGPGTLAVPLALALQAGAVSVALLAASATAPDAAASPEQASFETLEELGSLECTRLKVRLCGLCTL